MTLDEARELIPPRISLALLPQDGCFHDDGRDPDSHCMAYLLTTVGKQSKELDVKDHRFVDVWTTDATDGDEGMLKMHTALTYDWPEEWQPMDLTVWFLGYAC